MDVLVVTRLYPTPSQPYHAAFIPPRLRALAARADLRVVVPQAVYPLDTWHRRAPRLPAFESTAAYPIYRPGFFAPPGLFRKTRAKMLSASVCKVARRLAAERPFDVVLGHFLYPDGVAAAAAARLLDLPLVLAAHGSDVYLHGQNPHERQLITAAVAQADGLLCVSAALRDKMLELGMAAADAVILPSGYDADLFAPRDRAAARAALGLPQGPWLCYVGALRDLKRVDVILRALAKLPEVRLALVGGGPEADALASLARELNLVQRVRFVGPQPHERVPDWMAAADAVVLVSEHEGTPNVLIEALALGVPVVATPVGGIPELVGEVAPLVPVGDAEALAAAIRQILAAPPPAEVLRARVAGRTWTEVGERQAAVLRAAIEAHRRRAT